MPTVILNAGMSLFPDATLAVRSRDRLAVIAPMYNEERGAAAALASLLCQSHLPEELAISINGCTDGTYAAVTSTLEAHGYLRDPDPLASPVPARLERWSHATTDTDVMVIEYATQTAKSESINNLTESGLLRAERILIVDGDTRFRQDFIGTLRDNFYRLRLRRVGGRTNVTIEDVALLSGAVSSYVPPEGGFSQRVIAAARSAEYAMAGLLRRGQTRRFGDSPVWGHSRLYTVVGCGFVARRDIFPMPSDTLTEDHDLTLVGQSRSSQAERLTPRALAQRGLRPVVDGVERSPEELFDRDDEIVLWHSGGARFVGEAVMVTEDPPHLSGYLRQIERWHGGSVQNALKRLVLVDGWRSATGNVRFAVLSAVLENLLGLLLLLALPVLAAVNVANPSLGVPVRALGWWLGFDLAASALLVGAGYWRAERALGVRRPTAVRAMLRRTLLTLAPFMLLKVLNPIGYLAAASKVVPAFLRDQQAARRGAHKATLGVPWERPATGRFSRRVAGTAVTMSLVLVAAFATSYVLVPRMSGAKADAWRLVYESSHVDMRDHDGLPLATFSLPARHPPSRSFTLEPMTVALAPLSVSLASPVLVGSSVFASDADTSAPLMAFPASPITLTSDTVEPAGRSPMRLAAAPGGRGSLLTAVAHRSLQGFDATVRLRETPTPESGLAISRYCRPEFLGRAGEAVHQLDGDAEAYTPLSPFDRLMLARLAPIEPLVEGAATAYDVPATFLLQVLVNESYLDPLAVGATGDKGLSQMTSDALTMLRGLSDDTRSALYNPRLMSQPFSVYDPDFSVCGGAAKLAWASSHVGGHGRAEAYALYINPLDGVVDGHISERHAPAVKAMVATRPLLLRLGNAYAAYRADPQRLSGTDRRLLDISADLRAGTIDVRGAYRRSYQVVVRAGIDDRALYSAVLTRLFTDTIPSVRSQGPQGDGRSVALRR